MKSPQRETTPERPPKSLPEISSLSTPVSLGAATRVWLHIALLSFGGPAGQIALMHRVLVDQKKWISERRFLHALNFCMLLPGPEAQQLATYIGWLMHGTLGGLIAGGLFVLPGVAAIMALSVIYASLWRDARHRRRLLRPEGGGACAGRRRDLAARQARVEKSSAQAIAVVAFVCDLLFQRALSADCRRRWADRLLRRSRRLRGLLRLRVGAGERQLAACLREALVCLPHGGRCGRGALRRAVACSRSPRFRSHSASRTFTRALRFSSRKWLSSLSAAPMRRCPMSHSRR